MSTTREREAELVLSGVPARLAELAAALGLRVVPDSTWPTGPAWKMRYGDGVSQSWQFHARLVNGNWVLRLTARNPPGPRWFRSAGTATTPLWVWSWMDTVKDLPGAPRSSVCGFTEALRAIRSFQGVSRVGSDDHEVPR